MVVPRASTITASTANFPEELPVTGRSPEGAVGGTVVDPPVTTAGAVVVLVVSTVGTVVDVSTVVVGVSTVVVGSDTTVVTGAPVSPVGVVGAVTSGVVVSAGAGTQFGSGPNG
jgi:hypothetical protein